MSTLLFVLFMSILLSAGSARLSRRVADNVMAILMISVLTAIGVVWALSISPSGILSLAVPVFVVITGVMQTMELLGALPESMARDVMLRVTLAYSVFGLLVGAYVLPQVPGMLRESHRQEQQLTAAHQQLVVQQFETKVRIHQLLNTVTDAQAAMSHITTDAQTAHFGRPTQK